MMEICAFEEMEIGAAWEVEQEKDCAFFGQEVELDSSFFCVEMDPEVSSLKVKGFLRLNACAFCQPLHSLLQCALVSHLLKRRMIQSQRTTVGSVFCTDDAAVPNLTLPFCLLFHHLNQMSLFCEVLEVAMESSAFLEFCVLVLVHEEETQILVPF